MQITIKKYAAKNGVTPGRVRQLIDAGMITCTRPDPPETMIEENHPWPEKGKPGPRAKIEDLKK